VTGRDDRESQRITYLAARLDLELAPLTEEEYPLACWAWEEVKETLERTLGSEDKAAVPELGGLLSALAAALAEHERDPQRSQRARHRLSRWQRMSRRRSRAVNLRATLPHFGLDEDVPSPSELRSFTTRRQLRERCDPR
jgi:hypothetical protein